MPYHFIFREVIYFDDLHTPYEVPGYLSFHYTIFSRHCVTYNYLSRDYDTKWEAISDFYDVVMDSGLPYTPEFYVNNAFMSDSIELFDTYLTFRESEE